jgi:outer membrane protein OmpA-like peptidoglycan-associated protein
MIFFQSGSSALSEKARGTIRIAIESANQPLARTIDLVGHTDAAGSADANLNLSRRRAEAVKNALVSRGIAPSRISIVARGASWPLVQTLSPTEHNRRVEITVQMPISEQAVGYLSCRDGFRRIPSTTDPR